ncbi:MAG: glycoside hydrolase family 88 protein, partial [Lachnospiraceae bacterium]|nr:glycoside hydrolase family 88 protein [Lachnospiraceae bacterium]
MTAETRDRIQQYIDYLLENSSAEKPMWNKEMILQGRPNKWNYIDGCMITALLSLYDMTGEERYFKFAKDFVDYFVQEDGSIKTYDIKEYNLDNINTASNLFFLYEKTG